MFIYWLGEAAWENRLFRSWRRKSMKKKNTALTGALLLVLAGWSAADAAEIYTLDPIIVTAERTDTKE